MCIDGKKLHLILSDFCLTGKESNLVWTIQNKGYLRYKTIISQNVLSEAKAKKFFIL